MNYQTDEVKEILKAAGNLAILNDMVYAAKTQNVSYGFSFRGISFELSLTLGDSEVYLGVTGADVINAVYDYYMLLDQIEEIYQESLK
jgi:hypothetical protein